MAGVEADHVVAQLHHRAPPGVLDVAEQQHAEGAVVVGRPEPAVDLRRREHEAAPLAEVDDLVELGGGHEEERLGLGAGHGAPNSCAPRPTIAAASTHTRLCLLCGLVAGFLALAGCSSPGSASPPSTSATTGESTVATAGLTDPAETAPLSTALGAVPAGHCPTLRPVDDAQAVTTSHEADLDGDGKPDRLTTYFSSSGTWRFRVQLAAGGGADVSVQSSGTGQVYVVGGFNLDAKPGDEAFVDVGDGDIGSLVSIFQLQHCSLVRLLGPDGRPSAFSIGGTIE